VLVRWNAQPPVVLSLRRAARAGRSANRTRLPTTRL